MKVLYITNGINGSGGLERVLSVKASALAEEFGYQVSILCLNGAHEHPFYDFSRKIQFVSITVGGNPIQYLSSFRRGLQQVVNQIDPDVISVCDDGLKGFFVPNLIKTRAAVLYERHASINLNTDASLKGRIVKALMKRQVTRFDRFVVLTKGNIAEWNKPNVIAIPNPLGFEIKKGGGLNQKRIIAVGSHSRNKGYDLLLEVWKEVSGRFPDWKLDIFGRLDREQTFVKMAKEMNLTRVTFHEPVKDIRSEYLQSSVLTLPSRSEGFGMVLIEAMACGVPCVSFDCPSGPADIISEGQDGFLVENENTRSFGSKLTLLMENEELRQKMGDRALQNVERYLPQNIVKQWHELFVEITKNQ